MTFKKFSCVLTILFLSPFYSNASSVSELKHATQRFYIADDLDSEYQYHNLVISVSDEGGSSNVNGLTASESFTAHTTWPVSETALACFLLAGFLAARKQNAG